MNAITIGKLSDRVYEIIAERAREHGWTIEEEVAKIVERAVGAPRSPNWRMDSADRIAAMTPKDVEQTDSTLLIREDRDR
jgi:plasmid stability protein